MDSRFRVEVLNQTLDPQQVMYAALHQDYCEDFVFDDLDWMSSYTAASYYSQKPKITESHAGEMVIKQLLNGGRGHFGPIEHPQIVFNCGWFPHSVMQQIRTHRISVSFDVQSFRYSGQRIADLGKYLSSLDPQVFYSERDRDNAEWTQRVEDIFYLRPIGDYTDRSGKSYAYTQSERFSDLAYAAENAIRYYRKIQSGFSEEHARSQICFDVRQHWVMSFNARSLMHLLDLRAKADAQLECQQLCELILPHFLAWMPEVAEWYKKNRWAKARLAP